MSFRYRMFTLSLAACCALVGSVALAAKPGPSITPRQGESIEKIVVGVPLSAQATCTVGETGAPAFNVNYLLPPDDAYYTLLNPANCAGCAGGILQLNLAHVLLNFPVKCTIPVSVAIVKSNGAACPAPLPGEYVCGPLQYNLAPPTAGSFNFGLALPAGCCVDQMVFLEVSFLSSGSCSTLPRLITTGACNPCESYNVYPGGFDELCTDIGFPGNPIMNVDGDCCLATSTHTGTWGAIKLHYR
jgi:hypothetical protein